ncbi:MAG: hypothetical protein OEM22_06670, partial [Acidimicrobiia bacterium]|nr:hypothetical protein [Acidimicrobiia bacterium]
MRRFVASGMGVGLLPHRLWGRHDGAGSLGTVLAAIAGLTLWAVSWWWGAAIAAASIAVSLWAAAPFA